MKLIALLQDHVDKRESVRDDASRRVFPRLVEQAEFVLRAGVHLTFDDYLSLALLERLAFVRAADKLRAEEAQRVGLAASSIVGAAAATLAFDDGEALELLALEQTHAAMVAEVESP